MPNILRFGAKYARNDAISARNAPFLGEFSRFGDIFVDLYASKITLFGHKSANLSDKSDKSIDLWPIIPGKVPHRGYFFRRNRP